MVVMAREEIIMGQKSPYTKYKLCDEYISVT